MDPYVAQACHMIKDWLGFIRCSILENWKWWLHFVFMDLHEMVGLVLDAVHYECNSFLVHRGLGPFGHVLEGGVAHSPTPSPGDSSFRPNPPLPALEGPPTVSSLTDSHFPTAFASPRSHFGNHV